MKDETIFLSFLLLDFQFSTGMKSYVFIFFTCLLDFFLGWLNNQRPGNMNTLNTEYTYVSFIKF